MAGDGPETRPEMMEDPPANGGQARRQQAQNRGPPRAGATTGYGHSSPLPEPAARPAPSLSPSPSPSSPDRIGGHRYHHQRGYSYLEEGELPPRLRQPPYPPPHHLRGGRDGRDNQQNPRGGRQELPPQELLWQQHQRRHDNNNNNSTQRRGRGHPPRREPPEQQQQQYQTSGSSPWFAAPGGGGPEGYGYRYGFGGEDHQPATTALDEDSEGDPEATEIMDRDSRSRRYDDGEVTRYGAGESYRPFNSNRSPRRARSPPPRERARSPPLVDSDRYIPGRRRSRTPPDLGDEETQPAEAPRADRPRDEVRLAVVRLRRADSHRRDGMIGIGIETEIDCDLREEDSTQDADPDPSTGIATAAIERPLLALHPRPRPSPPRDSAVSSAVPSRDTSRRPSPPGGPPARRDDRSRPESPIPSRPLSRSSHGVPARDRSPQRTPVEPSSAAARSPPRGPAAFRPPPTGPRDSRGYGSQSAAAIGPPPRPAPAPAAPSSRHETSRNAPAPSPTLNRQETNTSPGVPPSGPRSHFSSRGGGYGRGGRGGSAWGPPVQSRNLSPTTGPASATPGTTGSAMPPTGPRSSISSHSVPSTPAALSQSKPFDPPKGPAADKNKPSFAQQLLASMPPLVPGGKADPAQLAMDAGVLPELLAHTQRLKEEEERIREEKYAKEERLRKSLAEWDRMERESRVMELRDQLAEETLKKISGEGTGGAAF
ncbi:hypothetical protein DL771_006919 [Monosporascus sp. 5C6A]|nr:hypothetical protein DL771_006919 [Monosporascus sp. 5C6A]